MKTESEAPPGKVEVAFWSLASVLLLALMCGVYLSRQNPEGYPALWYTLLLASPYLFIAVKCLNSQPGASVFGFANGVARATTTGILLVTVLPAVGLVLLLAQIPTPFAYSGMVGGEVAAQLQGSGLFCLLLLFAAQFPLASCARRAIPGATTDDRAQGRMYGFATLLIPFLIYGHINLIRSNRENAASEKSQVEIASREEAVHKALDARSEIALKVARTTLHVCVHSGCADSLLEALKRQEVAIAYKPAPHGQYFAVVAGSENDAARYVTNETGILMRLKDVKAPFGDVSWNSEYTLVDSVYTDLLLIRNCIKDETMSEWDEYPLHLPQNVGCYMNGDTTVVHFRHGANYRVIYASPRKPGVKLVKEFSLSMRPVVYGNPYVRSFLMTQDTVYVTTANRAARKTDPGVGGCEADSYHCGGRQ